MSRSRRRKTLPAEPVAASIDTLDQKGRGVAHIDGKAVFVEGALPGEAVLFTYTRQRRSYDEGRVEMVIKPSPDRVEPRCPHFGVCGGCSLQHMAPRAQILAKQRVLIDALERIGKTRPETFFPPLESPRQWGYRRKARLGVKYVAKKGKVLVGFRERGASFVTDLSRCEVLNPLIGQNIQALGALIDSLSIRERIPQIEMAMGDRTCVLVFRVLDPPSAEDIDRLLAFGRDQGIGIYLQDGGPDSIAPAAEPVTLDYTLAAFDITLRFLPTDFTQVNRELNGLMVERALELMQIKSHERVLDLFCGLGNFTLPMAQAAAEVVGVEGEAGLVQRARENAARNGIGNARFHTADLYAIEDNEPWLGERFDKVLLDPPRSGAAEVLVHLPALGVQRVVYVSCYPGTLARDADVLVNRLGYRLRGAGVMDMFPHTAHVESIAVFERD